MRIVIDISEEDLNIIEADEDFPSTNEETLWRLIDAVLSGKRISETDENGKRGSMTSKEALEILKKYKEESEEDYYVNRARVLDMAIKALEQESSENWYDVPSDEMTLEQARRAVKELRKKLLKH